MPHACEACGVLLLGPRAQPPDAAGGAPPSAQQATVRVSATGRAVGPGGGIDGGGIDGDEGGGSSSSGACAGGATLADAARWATDERRSWVDAAHAAGVRLILSSGDSH